MDIKRETGGAGLELGDWGYTYGPRRIKQGTTRAYRGRLTEPRPVPDLKPI